ncbi:OML4 [Enterospora canceri]|uniref:OML4 n=1 Tax=Enterospora canceri TaxID=1081671 RepID=A0A1Y1S6K2_9MICR|nr:OML4 [Enterospora canceri]
MKNQKIDENEHIKKEIKDLIERSIPTNRPRRESGINHPYSFPNYLEQTNFKPKYHGNEVHYQEGNKENISCGRKLFQKPTSLKFFRNEYGSLRKSPGGFKHNTFHNNRSFAYTVPKNYITNKFSGTTFLKRPHGENFYEAAQYPVRCEEYDKRILVPGSNEKLRDKRTTVMIKNIPNKVNNKEIKEILDRYVFGKYNFLYLRIDFENHCNVGYAFINFERPEHVIEFYRKFQGYVWDKRIYRTNKIVHLAYASIQGIEALKNKFKVSSVMCADPDFRPKMYHTSGTEVGEEKEFFE